MRRFVFAGVLTAACAAGCVSVPRVTVSESEVVLENRFVRRVLQKDNDVWRTVCFSRADGTDAMRIESAEFRIKMMEGGALTVADCQVHGRPVIYRRGRNTVVRIAYKPRSVPRPGVPKSVTVEYRLGDEPYLRKTVTLVTEKNAAVDTLEVERFRTDLRCDRGGRGEPVFVGDAWFVGLEYPGSETAQRDGLVTVAHFPGLAKKQDFWTGHGKIESKTAVAGVGRRGDPLELAFNDYLDAIRRPIRSLLHYNSWYDLRGDELNTENFTAAFESFRENLLDPYDLKMDCFVPDDGWQNPESIWVPKKHIYPNGLGPLRKALESRGTRLGIWLPLNGTNLNVKWGAEQGYEKSDRGDYYCLVGPKYNKAIRRALRRIIRQGNLDYIKHDFNHLRCTADGHGHFPDDKHGHETNLDAELELLAYERQVQPDIFLNITSYVWFSPWWLMHAESIWMAADDFGYEKTWPQLSPREWAMSYRDVHLYKMYTERRHLVPASALMTCGIIHGQRLKLGGDEETLRQWSDYAVMFYARGVQLKELYITPSMLSPERWKVLGEATRWAHENRKVLERVVMFGGDPRKGDIHGYAHWAGEHGIIALRNPALAQTVIDVPFDKSVQYRGEAGRPFRGRVIYPHVEDLGTQFTSGRPVRVTVPGASVMLVELRPGEAAQCTPAKVAVLTGATAKAATDALTITGSIPVPDEQMQRCEMVLLVRGTGKVSVAKKSKLQCQLNGQPVKTRRGSGPDWILHSIDLRPLRGKKADVVATLDGNDEQPFSIPSVNVSAWFVADRPATSPPAPKEHLPLAISQDFRRQTVELLPETKLERRREQPTITAEDLKGIKAAKLRILVFGVNGEPEYRDKFIFLNGRKLAPIPANSGKSIDKWQEEIIDLTPGQFGHLKMKNTIELNNAGGDCYKFTGLALAVQLPDGTWVESNSDRSVHCTAAGWPHTEGQIFKEGRSGKIELRF